ncbi:hypothetical protein SDJN03_09011, partial [Cucurbita argyrosperma subsp. sororia]
MLLNFNLLLPFSSGESNDVCISQGGRFPPFSLEGKPPKKVSKAQDLTLCRVFRKRTCCGVAQTHAALLSVRRLASTGEGNQECLQLWELLECSICDPQVGVRPGPPLICASFCNRVFKACSDAYFSVDAKMQVLAPCGVNDFVCGRASEWVSNGTELCSAAVSSQRTGYLGFWEAFQQWVKEMSFHEQVSWLIGSVVFSAGLLFARAEIEKAANCEECSRFQEEPFAFIFTHTHTPSALQLAKPLETIQIYHPGRGHTRFLQLRSTDLRHGHYKLENYEVQNTNDSVVPNTARA